MCPAHRSPLFRRLCLMLVLCFAWSFVVAPCAIAAEAAGKSAPAHANPPRHFTSLSDRLANTPYKAMTSPAAAPAPAAAAPVVVAAATPSRTLLDDVGRLARPVPAAQVTAWKRELKTTHPAPARAALLHLWVGECALAQDQQPETAFWHFRQAQLLTARRDPLYGQAAYDHAVASFYQGAYAEAADEFHHLLLRKTGLTGYDHRTCALWWRHAGACTGYHLERSKAGIPEPPRLDPQCGAAGLATSLQALGLPYDKKTVLASCRVTGEGSSLQDLINAGPRLGVTVRAFTADDAGLKALPKPLVSFCEHDHFIAVTKADNAGVTYLCSDCGMWPGGEVRLTWKQWHLLEPGVYATVTRPGSAWDARLAALPADGSKASAPTVRVGYAGKLSDLHLNAFLSPSLQGHVARYIAPTAPITCGYKPTSQQCPPYIICCWDCYEHAMMGGASDGDPVNLATGQEEYSPAPDLVVYNPVGPSVVWQRNYASLRSNPYAPFGLGWGTPYDISITGTGGAALLNFPNGSSLPFTPGTPPSTIYNARTRVYTTTTVVCGTTYGVPMRVLQLYTYTWTQNAQPPPPPDNAPPTYTGTPTLIGYQVVSPDRTVWNFGPNGGQLSSLYDRNGNGLSFTWNGSLLQGIKNAATNAALLTVGYGGYGGANIASVTDCYGRSVYYKTSLHNTSNVPSNYPQSYPELDHVSQIVPTGTSNPPDRYSYGYQNVYNGDPGTGGGEGIPALHTITVPSPAGPTPAAASLTVGASGTGTATINYATDGSSLVSGLVDGNGNSRTYTAVDGTHTKVAVANSVGSVAYSYTAAFTTNMNEGNRTDGGGSTVSSSTYGNDPYKPSSVTDGNNRTTTYDWDQYGNLLAETPPSNGARTPAVTTNTWDYSKFALGELVKTQEGGKSPTSYTYFDNSGATDYTNSGLVKTIIGPLPGTIGSTSTATTSYTYDSLGSVLTVTTPGNNAVSAIVTTYNYTTDGGYSQSAAIGQPLTETDSLGKVSHMRYDSRGNCLATVDALGNETDTTYNVADQPLQATLPATGQQGSGHSGSLNAYLYPGGPLTGATTYDEGGTAIRQTAYAYGKEGETLGLSGSAEPVTYTYDALYRLATLTDGGGHATRYYYKQRGYLDAVTYPGYAGPTPSYYGGTTDGYANVSGSDSVRFPTYDLDGNVTSRIDGNGVTTTYTHSSDPESLLTLIHYTYPGGYTGGTTGDVSLAYDAYGRRSGMTDGTGSDTYSYDDEDSPLSVATTYTGLPTQTVSYGYWPDGSRQSMAVSSLGGNFSYTYDAVGRMTGLTNPYGEASSWQYLDNGWLWKQTLGNGAVTAHTYNALGQTTDLQTKKSDGTLLSEYGGTTASTALLYDGAGDLTRQLTTLPAAPSNYTGVTSYQYDNNQTANPSANKGRLTHDESTVIGGYTQNYTYDGGATSGPGNPTLLRGGSALSYNADNGRSDFTYDGNGNPTAYKGASLKYDPESRLTQYGSAETNTYTGDGLRACKVFPSGGVTAYVWYVYDGDEPVAEVNGSGAATAAHTFGADGLVSRKVPGGDEFYTFDSQGSTAQQLDSGGNVLCSYLHDGFGNWVASASGADDVFGWGGQFGYYTDSQTGLRLCGHRFYDNGTARFLTRDPISYNGGVNLYGYCQNDPVNGIDPDGTSFRRDCKGDYKELQRVIGRYMHDWNKIDPNDTGHMKELCSRWETVKRLMDKYLQHCTGSHDKPAPSMPPSPPGDCTPYQPNPYPNPVVVPEPILEPISPHDPRLIQPTNRYPVTSCHTGDGYPGDPLRRGNYHY